MAQNKNPKRDKQLDTARKIAMATGEPFVDPAILFSRAAADDLNLYTAEMLALSAIQAQSELNAWDGGKPRVSLMPLEHIEVDGLPAMVLSVTNRNMPFLYDSVMGEVTASHRDIHLAVHPILILQQGKPVELHSADDDSDPKFRVSHIQIHLGPVSDEDRERLIGRIEYVLDQVQQAVRDWPDMLQTLHAAIADLGQNTGPGRKGEKAEALAFLNWLLANNFTFLGMRDYTYTGKGESAVVERSKGKGLGILSDPDVLVLRFGKDAVTTTPEILEFLDGPDFLIVTKANVKSVIHRRAYMDYIGVKRFDANGEVIGELRIVGLFTSTAYTQPATQIPLLRTKLQKVIDQFDYDPQSHSGKVLQNTLEFYPRDDLFQIDANLLASFCEQINELSDRPRVRVLPRIDHFDRFISVLVFVPRDQYDSDVRERIGQYLKTIYEGRVSAYYPAFPEGGVARVHFIIGRSGGKTPRIPQADLEAAIRDIATSWDDRFKHLAWGTGLSLRTEADYQAAFSPADAFADLPALQAVASGEAIRVSFDPVVVPKDDGIRNNIIWLKIIHAGSHLALSRRVPLLENLGFSVISEKTYDISLRKSGDAEQLVVLHHMELDLGSSPAALLKKNASLLESAFLDIFRNTIDDDSFNRLILASSLSARQVMVLRALARYLQQLGIAYSQNYLADTLGKHPAIAGNLLQLFESRFDPALTEKQRSRRQADLTSEIETELGAVPSLDEDRILRRYMNLIAASLRTNYFQTDESGLPRQTLAIKFDPKQIDELPEPKPFREIFVYGAEVEGVHLRFGKVARGGLRWSDRSQDYRTEVLGLVKAQQVKNAVIVPVGAKGGFFPKRLPAGGSRDAIFNAGRDAYKTFIRTLLSITDNLSGPTVVPPLRTVRLDGDDPYFVVAADKGTATFSDTANGLAQETSFWLDDAFASGGSVGYDHKKMGITARGAWEAVKRHFREINVDIQTTPFSVVGVGDMSGDVFGNGMLLSEKIRLIAAFDHRDIFIDPDPDMAATLAERQRLFALPRSSWQDFDRKILSKGAMIISRSEKSITLSEEACQALGLANAHVTPFDIMTAILKAQVDLLWFGGIGTYVKAADESDAEVGDRANDAIRILGSDVRAKVIGEGANLGVTQKGRIAYCLSGGRCNSDAIDNSAGVNSSDIEVNIKIALANAMRDERLTRDKRNVLLASMTDEVGHLVLRNNYLQTLAISLTERQGQHNGRPLERLMERLEGDGLLNRRVEFLPSRLAMEERYQARKPLTRPEIAVLLSYAKIALFDQIIASDLADDAWLVSMLTDYFPVKMQKSNRDDIETHRLRREIIATALANHVINRGGPAFVTSLMDQTGASAAEIVRASVQVRNGFDLPALWTELDALDGKINGALQNDLYAAVSDFYYQATAQLLRTRATEGPLETAVQALQAAVKAIRPKLDGQLSGLMPDNTTATTLQLEATGVAATTAASLARLSALAIIPELLQIQQVTGEPLERAAAAWLALSNRLHIGRILDLGHKLEPVSAIEEEAKMSCLDDIAATRRRMAIAALQVGKEDRNPAKIWESLHADRIQRNADAVLQIADKGETSLASLVVASGLLNNLA